MRLIKVIELETNKNTIQHRNDQWNSTTSVCNKMIVTKGDAMNWLRCVMRILKTRWFWNDYFLIRFFTDGTLFFLQMNVKKEQYHVWCGKKRIRRHCKCRLFFLLSCNCFLHACNEHSCIELHARENNIALQKKMFRETFKFFFLSTAF